MTRDELRAVARVAWVEPITYAARRPMPVERYPVVYRVLFWTLLTSAAIAVGALLVNGWG